MKHDTQAVAAREDAFNRDVMRRKAKRALRTVTPALLDRIYARVKAVPPPSGEHYRHLDPQLPCFLWQGAKDRKGHGHIKVNGKPVRVHRIIFKAAHGKFPPVVSHSCDVPACCAVYHLHRSTDFQNRSEAKERGLLNGWWKRGATHCKRGHVLTLPGSVVRRGGQNYCHECNKARARARGRFRYAAHRDEINARCREKYATDSAYKERKKARCRSWRTINRDEINARRRERYALAKQRLAAQAAWGMKPSTDVAFENCS